ncbi:MAG: GntR family transcriptional regulator [Hyphomicrobiaceae bacterium]
MITPTADLPAERPTLGARVHDDLRDLLVSGQLSPGEKLSLRTVAVRLGVSMQPVRQAVDRLVADGALEVLPNRAIRVPLMTLRRFEELTIVRLAIEGFAAETAAAAHSAKDLAAIRRADLAFRRQCLSRNPDLAAAIRANCDLHFAVYRAAGLPSLLAIIEGLWLCIGPILNLDIRSSPARLRMGAAEQAHGRLIEALALRDGPAVRAALESDIGGAAAWIRAQGALPA